MIVTSSTSAFVESFPIKILACLCQTKKIVGILNLNGHLFRWKHLEADGWLNLGELIFSARNRSWKITSSRIKNPKVFKMVLKPTDAGVYWEMKMF